MLFSLFRWNLEILKHEPYSSVIFVRIIEHCEEGLNLVRYLIFH
jgi:hypothetical protein